MIIINNSSNNIIAIGGDVYKKNDTQAITLIQIKKIHVYKSKLGMSDADYRERVKLIHGTSTTCKDLNYEQANELLKEMEFLAYMNNTSLIPGQKYEELSHREDMATPKQLRMIEALWKDVSFHKRSLERAKALRAFLQRFGIADMRFIDQPSVHAIIAALKSMKVKGESHE